MNFLHTSQVLLIKKKEVKVNNSINYSSVKCTIYMMLRKTELKTMRGLQFVPDANKGLVHESKSVRDYEYKWLC